MQQGKPPSALSYDLQNLAKWEHVMTDTPNPNPIPNPNPNPY